MGAFMPSFYQVPSFLHKSFLELALGAKVDRITRNHERQIEELEEHAGLKNPYKN